MEHDIKRRDFLKGAAAGAAGVITPSCERARSEEIVPAHRYIDGELCIGCGSCAPLCPMGAISLSEKASIDPDACAECGVCWRSMVCPKDAIKRGDLEWPRTLREVFSNPLAEHEDTGVAGRGTEGIKTNDSTGRYERGRMGVFIELGRPALGARFYDAEKVVKAFAQKGYRVVEDNPVAGLVSDPVSGKLKPEVLNEKAISILIEFIMPCSAADELLEILEGLSGRVDTVFNVSIALRAKPGGKSPLKEVFGDDPESLPNGKVNIGLAGGEG